MGGWFGGGGGGSSSDPVASVDPAIAEAKRKTEAADNASINKMGKGMTGTTYGGGQLSGIASQANLVKKVLLGQ